MKTLRLKEKVEEVFSRQAPPVPLSAAVQNKERKYSRTIEKDPE